MTTRRPSSSSWTSQSGAPFKIWGRAEVVEYDTDIYAQCNDPNYSGEPKRVVLFHVDAWNVNCRKHITPRFAEEEIGDSITVPQTRIRELEAQIRDLTPDPLAPEAVS